MKKVVSKLLELISESIQLQSKNSNIEIEVYVSELLEDGFKLRDIQKAVKKLIDDGVIIVQPQIKFASGEMQVTNPMQAKFSSVKTKEYNEAVYVFRVDRKKLKPLKSTTEIFYDKKSGLGFANDFRFKFKNDQPEFLVFGELCSNINNPVTRRGVLELSNYDDSGGILFTKNTKRKSAGHTNATYFINEITKEMRKRTGLTKNDIINNNGELTLRGKRLKQPPN